MSITNGNGTGIGIYCHSCGRVGDAVVAAVGLTWAELLTKREPAAPRIVAVYDYTDEKGTLLYQAVRFDPKDFRQRRPDPKNPGEWIWKLDGCHRVLYRLPEILAAVRAGRTIYVVEGEKDADSLVALGLDATTNAGGAGKWRGEYSEALRGANVVIIPDKDEPGRRHAEDVSRRLVPVVSSVKIVSLSGTGKDASDWIVAGGTREELERLAAADPLTVDVEEPQPLFVRSAADVISKPVSWLWPQRLPLGKLIVFAGPPGEGKSRITLSITSIVSTGGVWPCGEGKATPGGVLIANFEDDESDTTVPRLRAEGADLSQIRFLVAVPGENGPRSLDIGRDTDRIAKHLELYPQTRLLIIDPISAVLGGIDSHKNAEVRAVLHPLADIARRYGVCILAVTHLSKGTSARALDRVIGSVAFSAAARVVFGVCRDENDPEGKRRLFLPLKNNLGEDRVGLSFATEVVELPDGIFAPRIVWGQQVVTKADDAMLPPNDERGALEEAKVMLADLLAEGPVSVEQIKAEAKAAGVAAITLRRAKSKLRVTAQKDGVRGPWTWALPKATGPASAGGWEAL